MRGLTQLCTFLIFAVISTACMAEPKYFIDDKKLPANLQRNYEWAQALNDELAGSWWRDEQINKLINDFLLAEKNFLPIYIEKARYVLILGFIKKKLPAETGKEALAIIRDIQSKDPTYSKAYVLAGYIYTTIGDYAKAEESFIKAQELGTSDPWLQLNWAELLTRQEKYDEAMVYALKGLKKAGSNSKIIGAAVQNVSQLRERVENKVSMQALLALIFESYKETEDLATVAASFIWSYNGSNPETFDIAEEILTHVKEKKPGLPRADFLQAMILTKKGNNYGIPAHIEEARRILMPLRDNKDLMVDVYDDLVDMCLNENDVSGAIKLLDEAGRKPGIPKELINRKRGQIALKKKEFELAIYFFEEEAKTNPNRKYSSNMLLAYAGAGKENKVEEIYRSQLEWNPSSAWANGNYASHVLLFKGDYETSIKYGREALRLMDYPMARKHLAIALYLKWAHILVNEGNAEKARSYLEEAQEIIPDAAYIVNTSRRYPKLKVIKEALKQAGLYDGD